MEYWCHICAGDAQSEFKSDYTPLWVMDYSPACNSYSTDKKTLLASHSSLSLITMTDIHISYIA